MASTPPANTHPRSRAERPREDRSHVVQLYEQDAHLVASIGEHVESALSSGRSAVVIATPDHRAALEQILSDRGLDIERAAGDGLFHCLDAEETMATFMVGDEPDSHLFQATIGELVGTLPTAGGPPNLFGEMVALLWDQGNVPGALALEELWNTLGERHPFFLLCAYPIGAFDDPAVFEAFENVCETHSRVIPGESYTELATPDERLRGVALLQQQTKSKARESEELRSKQSELESALERLKELDRIRNEFVAMIVHDIRTPAAAVTGLLELLRRNRTMLDENQFDDLMSRSLSNTQQILHMADDILTVSKIDSGEFTYEIAAYDLAEIVYRAVGAIRDMGADVSFDVSIPSGLSRAMGDERRQMQVLSNLLTNAVKFSPSGAHISIDVYESEGELVVAVRDRGAGISPHEMEKLFQRFSRLRQKGYEDVKGNGLGLFITKELVEGQGGRIWVESKPGRGSTFSFSCPVAT